MSRRSRAEKNAARRQRIAFIARMMVRITYLEVMLEKALAENTALKSGDTDGRGSLRA